MPAMGLPPGTGYHVGEISHDRPFEPLGRVGTLAPSIRDSSCELHVHQALRTKRRLDDSTAHG
jgi:hypothetical protein